MKEKKESRKRTAEVQGLEKKRNRTATTLRKNKAAEKLLAKENAVIAEIGRIISSTLNIEEIYERFADETMKIIPFDRISIGIINEVENTILVAYAAGRATTCYPKVPTLPFERSLYGNIVPSQSSVLIQTADESEVVRRYPALQRAFRAGFRSMMAVPLISRDRVIGTLHFRSMKLNAYTDADMRCAERVGNQIAGAIAISQLFEALRKSEEGFRAMFNNMHSGVAVYEAVGNGADFVFKDFNAAAEHISRIHRDQVIGKNLLALFPNMDKFGLFAALQRVYRTGQPEHLPAAYYKDQYREGWRDNFIYRLPSRDIVAIYDDVTQRKQAESALLKSEEEAKRLAQENAVIAEVGRIISSTLNVEEVYERFAEEVRKIIPFDRIVINIINYEDNTFSTAYVAGGYIGNRCSGDVVPLPGSVNEEMVCTRKGLLFHLAREDEIADRFPILLLSFRAGFRSMLFAPLISNDEVIGCLNIQSTKPNVYTENDVRLAEKVSHQIAGAIANAQLFAAYKRAEKALRESEERFRDLYDNAPFGYHEYDREGRIVNVNRTDLEMLGYTREEMVGQFVWKFSAEEETVRDEILAKLAGTLPCGRSFERLYRRKDGTTFPVLVGKRVLLDEEGNIKSFFFYHTGYYRSQGN